MLTENYNFVSFMKFNSKLPYQLPHMIYSKSNRKFYFLRYQWTINVKLCAISICLHSIIILKATEVYIPQFPSRAVWGAGHVSAEVMMKPLGSINPLGIVLCSYNFHHLNINMHTKCILIPNLFSTSLYKCLREHSSHRSYKSRA